MEQLPIPPEVESSQEAVEVLRAWREDQYLQWAVLATAFTKPYEWGVLLADAAHRIADILASSSNGDRQQILREIELGLQEELYEPTEEHSAEQAVLVRLDGKTLPPEIYEEHDVGGLEDQIRPLLEQTGVGSYDGDEHGPDGVTLFLYGPDAEALFKTIEPLLLAYPLCRNARVEIRPGGHRARSREIRLPNR